MHIHEFTYYERHLEGTPPLQQCSFGSRQSNVYSHSCTLCPCRLVQSKTFFEEAESTGVIFTRGSVSRTVGSRADLTLGGGPGTDRTQG